MRVRLPDGACSLGVGGESLLPDADGVCLVDDVHRDVVLQLGCVEVGSGAAAEAEEQPAESGRRKRRDG